jgi:hypothetical protein
MEDEDVARAEAKRRMAARKAQRAAAKVQQQEQEAAAAADVAPEPEPEPEPEPSAGLGDTSQQTQHPQPQLEAQHNLRPSAAGTGVPSADSGDSAPAVAPPASTASAPRLAAERERADAAVARAVAAEAEVGRAHRATAMLRETMALQAEGMQTYQEELGRMHAELAEAKRAGAAAAAVAHGTTVGRSRGATVGGGTAGLGVGLQEVRRHAGAIRKELDELRAFMGEVLTADEGGCGGAECAVTLLRQALATIPVRRAPAEDGCVAVLWVSPSVCSSCAYKGGGPH